MLKKLIASLFGHGTKTQNSPDRQCVVDGYPPTFGPLPLPRSELLSSLIFDPALLNYTRAFRRGDPLLPPEAMRRWLAARREVMRHLLDIVASSPWQKNLVLRGSLSLKATLGEAAREPGDIDWVVQPAELRMDEPEAGRMMDGIVQAITANPSCQTARIDTDAIARNDIWTYDRAPGHRIAFPWSCDSLPAALVQMDFVFEQKLHLPSSLIDLQLGDFPAVPVTVASDEESLAWKLLWLNSDMYPQGKDLYDAVLLAERTKLGGTVLKAVLIDGDSWDEGGIPGSVPFMSQIQAGRVDWENFQTECPWIEGTAESWIARLQRAIDPTLRELQA